MNTDELSAYLDALERDDRCRVERVLKSAPHETTELVRLVGADGAESPVPYVRKRISIDAGMGRAYEIVFAAQQAGRAFPHLPRIVDCHVAGGELVVVMEHVVGPTLLDAVYERDPSLGFAREVFPPLCDAVSELHEGFLPPIIHRDLKPSNVILSERGPVVIDFGIARQFRDGADADTTRFGTRSYAPPEQFGFGQTDVRSDVYALGMVLYYCLTERVPTPGAGEEARRDPSIPDGVASVIARATAFDPAARFATVRELRAAFVRAAGELEDHSKRERLAVAQSDARASGGGAAARPEATPGGEGAAAVGLGTGGALAAWRATGGTMPPVPAARPERPRAVRRWGGVRRGGSGLGGGSADAERAGNGTASAKRAGGGSDGLGGSGDGAGRRRLSWTEVVGLVWDALLAGSWALFFVASTVLIFAPEDAEILSEPLGVRVALYYGVAMVIVSAIAYALLDRRVIGRRFPLLRRRRLRHYVVVVAAAFAFSFVTAGVVTYI